MKNFIIGALLCVVVALFLGVERVQRFVNEATNQETLRGVETCLSYTSGNLLSTEAVRSTCVAAFQKRLFDNNHATGKAGPRIGRRTVSWGGVLENKTSDHVTTWIQLSIGIFDAEGNEQEFSAQTTLWIDPLGKTDFKVELPDAKIEQFDDLKFCDLEDTAPKSCMSWGVTEMMGLSL